MKYKIIKAIDVAGLNFLTPIVLLCCGDEPIVQIKKIGQFIVVPLIAIVLFLGFWAVISEKVQTKSGKLPDPVLTAEAADSLMILHVRSQDKEQAYSVSDDQREQLLASAQAELEAIEPEEQRAKERVGELEAAFNKKISDLKAPLEAERAELTAAAREAKKTRLEGLKTRAETLPADPAQREAYLQAFRDHNDLSDRDRDMSSEVKAKIGAIEDRTSDELDVARLELTALAERSQHLRKLIDTLSKDNRSVKVAAAKARQQENIAAFMTSEDPAETYKLARSIVSAEPRIETMATAEFPPDKTLPRQIIRSIVCVFVGFIIGVIIAIPLGILCGLSSTFMAAMTPFIAVFKPVSPIIWVIILLIIVGGFIPDPDKHPLMQFLWDLPLIGWMKINPAFIASALTVSMCSLWATLANTALGVASIEKDHINVARVLKLGFWERLFKIVIPSSLPLIFSGMRISLGVGWMVLIAAEVLSSSDGIGMFVWDQFNNGASDSFAKIMVSVFVVGFIGLILDRIMIVFQRFVSFDGAPTAI